MADCAIRIRKLTKRYGAVRALAGVDLDVSAGEIVSLLGPNGAGKSTLLRILGTTVTPDSGSALVSGIDVASEPALARRRLGQSIGDERSLYWRLTGRRNLEFFGALHGLDRAASRTHATDLLEAVGLLEASDRPVRNYSSGMRTRLALARALVGRPAVLLLDEPTGSLDPLAAARFRETMSALARERDTAILLATHDLHEAVEVSGRVAVLSEGRITHDGPASALDAAQLERIFLDAVEAGDGEEPTGALP